MADANYHCDILVTDSYDDPGAVFYTSSNYDRDQTKDLFNDLKARRAGLGRDLHKKTFFNDGVLINQVTEMQKCCSDDSPPYSSHDEHLHVRFCTAYYPYDSRYDC